MTWMTLLLTCGSVLRLTQLVQVDSVTFDFRDWLAGRSEKAKRPKVRGFFESVEYVVSACPWCLSIWMGVVAPLAYFFGDTAWFIIPAVILTASQITGMIMTGDE